MAYEDSFFWKLGYVRAMYFGSDKEIKKWNPDAEKQEYSDESKTVLNRLIDYVVSGSYTDSEPNRYITKYYWLKPRELVKKYYKDTGVKKTESCFRSQKSTLSKKLLKIFGNDFTDGFLDNNPIRIKDILNVLEVGDKTFHDVIIPTIKVMENCNDKEYLFEELEEELRVLKKYTTQRIDRDMQRVNKEKLAYIKKILNSSLLDDQGLNYRKMKLLEYLLQEIYNKPKKALGYTIPSEYLRIMVSAMKKGNKDSENEDRDSLKELVYYAYTQEGINDFFGRYNKETVQEVMNEINKGK